MNDRKTFIGCAERIYYENLRNGDNEYVNNATVKYSIFASEADVEANTNPLSGAADVAMPSVPGTDGRYESQVPASVTAAMTKNAWYWYAVTVTVGGVQVDRQIMKSRAMYKTPEHACDC